MALYDLAWSVAQEDLRGTGQRTAAGRDPSDPATARDDRHAAYLALLNVFTQVRGALETNVEIALAGALAAGSNFGEIGEACGISRQAARQKWMRLTREPPEPTQPAPAEARHPLPPKRVHPRPVANHGGVQARVHELAAELGLTSKQVLKDLAQMGEHVISASSTVASAATQKLRAMYKTRR